LGPNEQAQTGQADEYHQHRVEQERSQLRSLEQLRDQEQVQARTLEQLRSQARTQDQTRDPLRQ